MRDTSKYFPTELYLNTEKEHVSDKPVRLEGLDAEQIRKPKKAHGGGKPRPDVREEEWRTTERGEGFQQSGRWKHKEAARKKAVKEKEDAKGQRTLALGMPRSQRRYFPPET